MNRILCESCSHRLKYSDDNAGKKGRCPRCGHPFLIPSSPTPDTPQDSTASGAAEARGAALAHLLNTLGEQASARHPDDPEAASQEAARRLAGLLGGSLQDREAQARRTANIILGSVFAVFWLAATIISFVTYKTQHGGTLYLLLGSVFVLGPLGAAMMMAGLGLVLKVLVFLWELILYLIGGSS